jgi:P pilus assembly chaperone PapD
MTVASSSTTAAKVSMTPSSTRMTVAPGSHGGQTVTIGNMTDGPISCRLRLHDWTIEDGLAERLRYHPSNTQKRSCTEWLQVWPTEFEIPAGGLQEISLSVTLPENAIGSYFSAFIVDIDPVAQASPSALTVATRVNLGHLITVDTEGNTNWHAELEGLRVSRPDDTRGLEIHAVIRNRGNAGLRPGGSFAIVDASGLLMGKVEMKTYFAQPGGDIRVAEQWDGPLAPGKYQIIGTIELGGGRFLTPEMEFEVVDHLELMLAEVVQREGRADAIVRVENRGNITAVLRSTIRVNDTRGATVESPDAPDLTILPGEASGQTVPLGSLPPGEYELTVLLENEDHSLASSRHFRIR